AQGPWMTLPAGLRGARVRRPSGFRARLAARSERMARSIDASRTSASSEERDASRSDALSSMISDRRGVGKLGATVAPGNCSVCTASIVRPPRRRSADSPLKSLKEAATHSGLALGRYPLQQFQALAVERRDVAR